MKKYLFVGGVTAVLLLVIASCTTQERVDNPTDPVAFTLQLLHFADVDGNEEIALAAVDKLSALAEGFKSDPVYGVSTLVVSSGDNIIPGPRFYAAEQNAVRSITGSNEPGHVDIAFLNYLGVQASAFGNHDLDAGPGEFADAIQTEENNGIAFPGSLFPYLSANLDFETEEDMAELVGPDGELTSAMAGKVASSTVANVGGELIGIVGASTPNLGNITTTGGIRVRPAGDWDTASLAAEIQPAVDALSAAGINKIILLSHMQQISVEKELAALLQDVDIIVAGGSNTRMGDSTDTLFDADDAFDENYPWVGANPQGQPVLVVNVDGDYKYLGRLVVGFDFEGTIALESIDEDVSGAWASTSANVATVGGSPNPALVAVRDAVQDVILAQYGNVLGYTSVYLDGRRSQVRTEETNLGNLSAEANLWYANQLLDGAVDVSIKNGGGIRTEIGSAIVPPGSVDYSEAVLSPPLANEKAGTVQGAITEGHLRATLRFDNGLAVLSATAAELKGLLEHGIAETAEGTTPGRFPQVAGMRFSFDAKQAVGSKIQSLEILDENGTVRDTVVSGGILQGDAQRRFRLVTLNFLANGGDGYPYTELSAPNRTNLYEGTGFGEDVDYPDADLSADPGSNSSFSYTGGEQDALAEYLGVYYATPDTAFDVAETPRDKDKRISY